MDEVNLLQLLKEKDEASLLVLIDTYLPLIEKMSFQSGIDPQEIPTVVQNTINYIYRRIEVLEEDTMTNWIYISTCRAIKNYKQPTKDKNLSDFIKAYGYYLEHREKIILHYCIAGLDYKYKLPLVIHYFHRKTLEEIANILHIDESKVKQNIEDGFLKLEKVYKSTNGDEQHYENMESLLSEIQFDYDRLPLFTTDKQEILFNVKQLQANQKWKKFIPIAIGVVAFIAFSIFSMNYLSNEKEKQAIQAEEEKRKENIEVTEEPTEEAEELDPEIIEYFENAKKMLAEEFNVDSVNHFPLVSRVELILKDIKANNRGLSEYAKDESKYFIDHMLTPPSIFESNLDPDNAIPEHSLTNMLYAVAMFENDFQEYLIDILTKHQISSADYHAIVTSQELLSAYDGPQELTDFISTLTNQGYMLQHNLETETLNVKYNFERLKQILTAKGYSEGYLAYTDLAPQLNNYYFGNTDWEDFPEILIELETIVNMYGSEFDDDFYNLLMSTIGQYLNGFITGLDGYTQIEEQNRKSYYLFLDDYPDSVFWEIINETVKEWEENNWVNDGSYVDFTSVRVLFDERFENIKWKDITLIYQWPPLSENTITIYQNYKEAKDLSSLIELEPFEIVSLYDYVNNHGEQDLFSFLTTGEETLKWPISNGPPHLVMTEYTSDHTAFVHLASWDLQTVDTLEMKKVDGIWRFIH
ncbi:RNA polymerase sigma factor [Ornithinibacillus halotolerans]|uniref:Uncharacterized protein n=1 Tax=Ornithinibacillus halotolerans TaxID=1274357 RepID=A0A916W8V2_9BACI|nr:sigma-70 family RNA polymerase sigma factor [Ornithinibacillus halotolerans]GGA76554.1 hypothetical protein GCM10008025_20200 [Ornithinibacillus halotolerans]